MITIRVMTLITVQLAFLFISWIFFAIAIYRASIENWNKGYRRGIYDEQKGLVIHFDEG